MMTALIVGIVVVGLLCAAVLARPKTFRVERSTVIRATPEAIFPMINDLHRFSTWNPYERMDPQIKGSYSGSDAGKGAAYAWESAKVGSGRMEIIETQPVHKVLMRLDFLKPFEGHSTAEFTLEPRAETTAVTWAMYGKTAFIPGLLGLVFSQDKMIGGSFESGLANLKAAIES